jgi:acyl-CoA thioester hydrolase
LAKGFKGYAMSRTEAPAAEWFEHPVVVRGDDIDANGHANNVAYLRWVQEAAVAHWSAVAEPAATGDISWVVVRHEIDYKRPAFRTDALLARTWLGAITAATTERFCEILRGGELLARARTVWCLVDAQTGRPRRIDARIRSYFSGPGDRPGAADAAAGERP